MQKTCTEKVADMNRRRKYDGSVIEDDLLMNFSGIRKVGQGWGNKVLSRS